MPHLSLPRRKTRVKSAWKRADALRSSGFDVGDVAPRGDDPPLMQQWSGRPFAHLCRGWFAFAQPTGER